MISEFEKRKTLDNISCLNNWSLNLWIVSRTAGLSMDDQLFIILDNNEFSFYGSISSGSGYRCSLEEFLELLLPEERDDFLFNLDIFN